jgi:hypothetical protein
MERPAGVERAQPPAGAVADDADRAPGPGPEGVDQPPAEGAGLGGDGARGEERSRLRVVSPLEGRRRGVERTQGVTSAQQDLGEGPRRPEIAPGDGVVEKGDRAERTELVGGGRRVGRQSLESGGEGETDRRRGRGAGPAEGGAKRRLRAPGIGGEEALPSRLEGCLSPQGEAPEEEREPRERGEAPEESADGGLQRAFASAPAATASGPSPRASR